MSKKSITEVLGAETIQFFNDLRYSVDKDFMNDSEYKKARNKVKEVYEKLKALVPEDKADEFFNLMDEYDQENNELDYVSTLHVQHKTFKICAAMISDVGVK